MIGRLPSSKIPRNKRQLRPCVCSSRQLRRLLQHGCIVINPNDPRPRPTPHQRSRQRPRPTPKIHHNRRTPPKPVSRHPPHQLKKRPTPLIPKNLILPRIPHTSKQYKSNTSSSTNFPPHLKAALPNTKQRTKPAQPQNQTMSRSSSYQTQAKSRSGDPIQSCYPSEERSQNNHKRQARAKLELPNPKRRAKLQLNPQ